MAVGHAKCTGGVGVCLAAQGPGRRAPAQRPLRRQARRARRWWRSIGQDSAGSAAAARQEIGLTRLFGDACAPVRPGRPHPDEVVPLLDQAFRTAVADPQPDLRGAAAGGADAARAAAAAHGRRGADPARRASRRPGCCRTRATSTPPPSCSPPVSGSRCWSGRAPGAPRRSSWRSPTGSAPASPPRCWASRFSTSGCRSTPGCSARSAAPPAAELMGGCDTLLMVGTNDPWTDYYPVPGQARAVQIDIDGRRIGDRYPVDVPLVGDAAETLRALLTRLGDGRRPRLARPRVEESVDRWRVEVAARADAPAEPVNPQFVLRSCPRLPRIGHPHRRRRLGDLLVRPAPAPAVRGDRPPQRRPRGRRLRPAVRDRGEARRPAPAGGRAGRRRGDAAQRPGRADHRGAPLAAVARSAAGRAGAQQPRPQRERHGRPGGARRPAGCPTCRTPAGPACSGCTASGWTARSWSARPGTRRSPPTGRP